MEAQLAQSTGPVQGPLDERSALTRARSGDRHAFGQLLSQHQARVYGIALRLTGLPVEAAHLAQEVFIELYSALPRIASPGHLTRWLLRETTRRVLQWVRAQAVDGRAASLEDLGDLPPRRLLLQLPPDARAIVLLRFQEGLESEEIAAVLGVTESLVEHSLRRALDWMAAQGAPGAPEFESLLRASLVAPDPGPEFTERVLAHTELRWSHRRRAAFSASGTVRKRGRFLMVGTALVVVLGAAWLVLHWPGNGLWSVAGPPITQEPVPPEPAAKEAAPPQQNAATSGTPAADLPAAPVEPVDVYPHYIVIAAPLRQQAQDPAVWAWVESFHAALLDELRKVPEVTLLVPGLTAPPTDTDPSADYLLTVTSLATSALRSGAEGFRITDGPRSGGEPPIAREAATGVVMLPGTGADVVRRWPVEIRIQSIGKPQSRGFTSVVQVGPDSTQLAAQQIATLRARYFPDVLARQRLATIIRDDSKAPLERNRALFELLGALAREHGAGFDSSTVSTIVNYAAVLPAAQRAQVWRSLRGMPHRELVAGLIESVRRDPDEEVRFEALATLAADYPADAAARSAIGSVATEDSEEVIRMAARRVLQGDAQWRAYVLTSLVNTGVSPDKRLEPLVLLARSATIPAEVSYLQGLVQDPETMRALMNLVGEGWFDPQQLESTGDALSLLAQADNSAAYDLLVQMPRWALAPETNAPGTIPSEVPAQPPLEPEPEAARPPSGVSAANMSWLQEHQNNPRVRRMLQDIESGRADPRLNAAIEQMRRQEQRGFPQRPPQR